MRIRFQADDDLNEKIITGVRRREPAIDFQTAAEAGLHGLSDAEVLTLAARAGRVLVSHDFRTMPTEFARFVQAFPQHGIEQRTEAGRVAVSPGLLICRSECRWPWRLRACL